MPYFHHGPEEESPPYPKVDNATTATTATSFSLPGHKDVFDRRHILSRQLSEESIRTELCEGPIPDSPKSASPTFTPEEPISDRAELIARLKRGETPRWTPDIEVAKHHLPHLQSQNPTSAHVVQGNHELQQRSDCSIPTMNNRPRSAESPYSSTQMPTTPIRPTSDDGAGQYRTQLEAGLGIERPRSALHSGDFRQSESLARYGGNDHQESTISLQGPAAHENWLATTPPRDYLPFTFGDRKSFSNITKPPLDYPASSLSSSIASSFAYKPPTSPLAQSVSNSDNDPSFSGSQVDLVPTQFRSMRRSTLSASFYSSPLAIGSPAMLRRESTYPYQAHQPRRSLGGAMDLSSSAQSPPRSALSKARRTSISSEASSLQQTSLIGSYEESILRGRMSTTPSKPFEFVAQIGVLGLGKCQTKLKCPRHVSLSFPAVFYSYASTPNGQTNNGDGPSPYVGEIDLENGLPDVLDLNRKRPKPIVGQDTEIVDGLHHRIHIDSAAVVTSKIDRQSELSKAPPGGSYRLPGKGQLQIVIKNQNKTAVKLFLVPYDVRGMEAGTKTFIRQRSYASARPVPGQACKQPRKETLRYLVHLHICCPCKGRYFLYKSIRIVFANRVPDGSETLRDESMYPEPRYSAYRPVRVMQPLMHNPDSIITTILEEKERAHRRRSLGASLTTSRKHTIDSIVPLSLDMPLQASSQAYGVKSKPTPSVPRSQAMSPYLLAGYGSATQGLGTATTISTKGMGRHGTQGLAQGKSAASAEHSTNTFNSDSGSGSSKEKTNSRDVWYSKLNKGDAGYGGNAFPSSGPDKRPGSAESLLSRQMRDLNMEAVEPSERPRRPVRGLDMFAYSSDEDDE